MTAEWELLSIVETLKKYYYSRNILLGQTRIVIYTDHMNLMYQNLKLYIIEGSQVAPLHPKHLIYQRRSVNVIAEDALSHLDISIPAVTAEDPQGMCMTIKKKPPFQRNKNERNTKYWPFLARLGDSPERCMHSLMRNWRRSYKTHQRRVHPREEKRNLLHKQ
jgi:hypothetical protein